MKNSTSSGFILTRLERSTAARASGSTTRVHARFCVIWITRPCEKFMLDRQKSEQEIHSWRGYEFAGISMYISIEMVSLWYRCNLGNVIGERIPTSRARKTPLLWLWQTGASTCSLCATIKVYHPPFFCPPKRFYILRATVTRERKTFPYISMCSLQNMSIEVYVLLTKKKLYRSFGSIIIIHARVCSL